MSARFLNILLGLLSLAGLATACLFMYQVIHYSTNAPIGNDDIDLILIDTIAILKAQSFDEWLTPMLHQNAEHRPAMLRLMGLLSYITTGKISLPFINIVSASVFLFSLLALLRSSSRSWKETLWMAGWAIPLVVAPLHHECLLWASCSGSHYTVIAFGCIGLLLALRTGWLAFICFEIACLLALLSLFSGLLVPLLGGLAIWWRPEQAEKKRTLLWMHAAITLSSIGLYVVQLDLIYKYLPQLIAANEAYPDAISTLVPNALIWFFAWLGAWLDIGREIQFKFFSQPVIDTPWFVACVGAAEMLAILIVLWRGHRTLGKQYLHIRLMLVYLVCTIPVAALMRSMLLPFAYIFTSRYQVYTQWLVICLLGLLLILLRNNKTDGNPKTDGNDTRFRVYTAALCIASLMFYASTFQRFYQHPANTLAKHTVCLNDWKTQGTSDCWWHDDIKIKLNNIISTNLFQMD
jgi:hypothetical protein